jgi:DNA-binding MarR family transcriptional regulator
MYLSIMSKDRLSPGLGELLRYVGELVDQGASDRYRAMNLEYRPRYTPVLRALSAGAETITDITRLSSLTQGAISQSVSLMLKDGLVGRHDLDDGRKSGIHLTAKGKQLLKTLEPHWVTTFDAIRTLEKEIRSPLLSVLQNAANALERKGFAERLETAAKKTRKEEKVVG